MHPQPTFLAARDGDCEVLLVRHARSQDIAEGVPLFDPDLHADAAAQLRAVSARLAPLAVDAVYSSHLQRARKTAEAIAAPHGLSVATNEDLREVDGGDWGRNGEFRKRASSGDPEWLAWSRTRRWDGLPGGEGDTALRSRMRAAVDGIASVHLGERVVIVSHNAAINAYLADVLETPLSIWLVIENTSITVVRIGPNGHTLVTAADCHHLYDPVLGRS